MAQFAPNGANWAHLSYAIKYFLQGDIKASKKKLQRYKVLDEAGKTKNLTEKNQTFCNAYSIFINHLIKKSPPDLLLNENKIYHIGESHCLSYAHHNFTTECQTFRISPKIVFGAKAYHFSKPQENAFKAITMHNLDTIPNNSLVFISIGEIDCRINEGFIPASRKTGILLAKLIQKTVIGYLNWFLDANVNNNHRYKFFNVPAPAYMKECTLSANQDAANVVHLFNDTLNKALENYSFGLIDVFRPTRAENGFSNNLYHCDGIHLDSRILGFIQDQINQ